MVDREEKDATQKAKFIFLSIAAAVFVLLLVSFFIAGKARSERDALRTELEACKQDNAKLTQYLDDQTRELDKLKKQVGSLQVKTKAKPATKTKPAPKAGTAAKKKTTKSK